MTLSTSLETTPVSAPNESLRQDRPKAWWLGLQLACFAFFVPLSRLSGSQRALSDLSSVLLVGAAVTVAGIVLYLALSRVTRSRWKALVWASTCVIFFWQWGAWSSLGPLLSWVASSALLAVVLFAVGRVAERQLFNRVMLVSSITLVATVSLLISTNEASAEPASLQIAPLSPSGDPVRRPDVIFVALDGYAREDILREFYSYDNEPFVSALEASGFEVAASANANYTATHTSVTSMLNMGYLEFTDGAIDNADLEAMAASVSGDNAVVRAFRDYGYQYVHGSTDNWLNQCSNSADVCLDGPAMDQTAFSMLTKTPVGPLLFQETGNPTTHLNLTRIDQLRNWEEVSERTRDHPTLTYLHLLLPHPPLFLDSSCNPRVEPYLGGQLLGGPEIPPRLLELRKAAYADQLSCANSTVLALLDQLEGNEIIVIASDHGPDSLGTLDSDPSTWNQDQIRERLATLTAIRLPRGCENPQDENLQAVNIFRIVLGCIQGSSIPLLEPTFQASTFSGPMIALNDPDVTS